MKGKILASRKKSSTSSKSLPRKIFYLFAILFGLLITVSLAQERQTTKQFAQEVPSPVCLGSCPTPRPSTSSASNTTGAGSTATLTPLTPTRVLTKVPTKAPTKVPTPTKAIAVTKPKGSAHNTIDRGIGDTTGSYARVLPYTDIIDINLRESKDHIPVGMHNKTIDATTRNTGNVSDLSWSYLSKVVADDGSRIPSLYWYTNHAPSSKTLFIELKSNLSSTAWTHVDYLLSFGGLKNRAIFFSTNNTNVKAARSRGYATGYYYVSAMGPKPSFATVKATGAKYMWAPPYMYTVAEQAQFKAAGIRFVMRCDAAPCFTTAAKLGVWAISTEHIQAYKAWKP